MNQRKTSERIRPVLFNTEMVKALLEGRKTVTRRVVKPQPQESETNPHRLTSGCYYFDVPSKRFPGDLDRIVGPYWPPYQPGDILWVRETWAQDSTIKPRERATYGWGANPWVWVIQFEHCEKPSGFEENRG